MLQNPQAVEALQSLLQETLRISISDGRIFIGTFVGTDKAMNILLVNTDEFRLGPKENPDGRFVGQVLHGWRIAERGSGIKLVHLAFGPIEQDDVTTL
ncbi:unnamed protein product [Peniophora sp. CBMAI 1063]|nr:unnamed protein product [Peniophora sp. CBMAI 1063]